MPYGELKHSGRTIKEAPAREASRTLERARERLRILSGPGKPQVRSDFVFLFGNRTGVTRRRAHL